ncbi:hypothetical protein [Fluviispira multicolorata]|nr:hypothetical protein [Fluviispira multicolorata]
MLNVLSATSILFNSIFVGFLFGRFKVFTAEDSSTLIRYVYIWQFLRPYS